MADIYDLIERVQVTLASSRSPSKEQLNELHGELTDQIRRANRRLRECDALLAKGHRTEAIQLAEQEPPLLDLVAILDFAELPEWNDFVAELGLTVAPELQIEIAADLNRAYNDDSPLELHLRKLRLLSLARVPLRERINLLKKIADLDTGNSIWESDRRNYEEVRLRQIGEEYQLAQRNRDTGKLKELSSELRGKWLVTPAKSLIGRINQALKGFQQEDARQRLKKKSVELQQAHDDKDFRRASQLGAEWESLSENCGDASEVHDLRKRAQNALRWIAEQRKLQEEKKNFEAAIERLQRAIDSGHDIPELERRHRAVERFRNLEIPAEVSDAYDAAIFACKRRRKLRLIIASASIAAGVVIVGLLFLLWHFGS